VHLIACLVFGQPDPFNWLRIFIAFFLIWAIFSARGYRRDKQQAALESEIYDGQLLKDQVLTETINATVLTEQEDRSPQSVVHDAAPTPISGKRSTDGEEKSSPVEVFAVPKIPHLALLCCLAALGLVGYSAYVVETMYAWLAIAPALAGVALLMARLGSFYAILDSDAVKIFSPRAVTVPYEDIHSIQLLEKRPREPFKPSRSNYTIGVVHTHGTFEIPPKSNIPSDELFRWLLERIPPAAGQSQSPPPRLVPYWRAQIRLCGQHSVLTYRSRKEPGMVWCKRKTPLLLGLAAFATAAIWIGASDRVELKAVGVLISLVGLVWLLLSLPLSWWLGRFKNAGLVVSPRGFALFQKPYVGYAEWHEVTGMGWHFNELEFSPRRYAILITVKEQHVCIYDIYDRPLPTIYRQMYRYWCGKDPLVREPETAKEWVV